MTVKSTATAVAKSVADTSIDPIVAKLARNEVTFSASWCGDYRFYMLNKHVALGICCSYPGHPFGRCRRVLFLFASTGFGFFLVVAMNKYQSEDMLAYTLLSSLLQMAFDFITVEIASCRFAKRDGVPCIIRCLAATASRLFMFGCGLLGIVLFVAAIIALEVQEGRTTLILEEFFSSKGISLFLAFPLGLVMYAWKRANERRKGVDEGTGWDGGKKLFALWSALAIAAALVGLQYNYIFAGADLLVIFVALAIVYWGAWRKRG